MDPEGRLRCTSSLWRGSQAVANLRSAVRANDVLPKLHRGVCHPYRRLWASERKALPSKDVAHAGGWKDIETMLGSYVQSDAATVLRVVENA